MGNHNESSEHNEYINKKANVHKEYTDVYLKLLETYNNKVKQSFAEKSELKKKFFYLVKWILIVLLIFLFISIATTFVIFYLMVDHDYKSIEIIGGALATIISSFVSVTIAIFKLPQIIASYLYDKNEDNLMNEVIKNIQSYELSAAQLENKAELDAKEDKIHMSEEASQINYPSNEINEMPTDDSSSETANPSNI